MATVTISQKNKTMNISDQSAAVLKPLIIYCLEHDMLDTAEFTAERLLAQESRSAYSLNEVVNAKSGAVFSGTNGNGAAGDVGVGASSINNKLNNNAIGTPTPHSIHNSSLRIDSDAIGKDIDFEGTKHAPNRKSSLAGLTTGVSTSKLDAIHLYACVLFRRNRFKAAYNVTSEYCTLHIGCSYMFAKACKELQRENEGIRALLRTMNLWESRVDGLNKKSNSNIIMNGNNYLIPDSVACYMLLAKLYCAVGDIPRASMHYSQILKLNPFIFEAFEELARLGVHVRVDAIYKNKDYSPSGTLFHSDYGTRLDEPILEAEMEQDLDLNDDTELSEVGANEEPSEKYDDGHTGTRRGKLFPSGEYADKSRERGSKNIIFKTPKGKPKPSSIPTSSPESTFITPVTKSYSKVQAYNKSIPSKSLPGAKSSSSTLNSSIPRKGPSITSRLLHNPTSSGTVVASTNSDDDINFLKKDTTAGSKRDMLSAFGIVNGNNDVFTSSSVNKNSGYKYVRNNSLNGGLNGIGNSSTLFDEHDVMRNLSNEYLLSVYYKLAKGYLASTTYDCFKAIRIFDSLPENERNTPWVLSKLGRLHFEIVNYEEAENYFEKLRKIDRTRLDDMEYYSTLLWHLHKEVELSYLAHELFEVDPNSAISWISIGNLFSFRKEPEDAVRCFSKAIECQSTCAYAYTLQGHEYLATDAFENALSSFRHAIVLDKRHYNAFYGIGMVYLKLGDFRKAEFHFRKAVEINPVNVILICCVGMVLEKLGRKEESLKQYEFATKLQPLSMLALFKKAQVLFSLKQYDDALKDFEKLENLAPDEASVHFLLGKLYKHYGRKHEAIKQFTIALNLDPKGSHLIKEAMENLNDDMVE